MRVLGEARVTRFAAKYADSRRPLARFLEIARQAHWPHFPAVKQTFGTVDYAPASGTIIFDIAGNKYRLIARVDFVLQMLNIEQVLTHEEYDRSKF